MSATCGMCGDCCKVIVTAKRLREYRDLVKAYGQWVRYWQGGGEELPEGWNPEHRQLAEAQFADGAFISRHWHRISQTEAAQRLPGMGYPGWFYYTCDMWNEETKLCNAGEGRPPICKGFPWYGQPIGERRLHPAFRRCTYWHDVPRERWHEGVNPLPLIQIQRKEDA